jgi:hypothetical protein
VNQQTLENLLAQYLLENLLALEVVNCQPILTQ